MNSDQFMHWLEGFLDGCAADDRDIPHMVVEQIRTKMARVEKPAAGNYEQDYAPIDYGDTNRGRDARMACLQIALGACGQNYGNIVGVIADAAKLADYVVAGVNPAGPVPKSDPTAVPFESVDDTVEDLKRHHPIAHHQV